MEKKPFRPSPGPRRPGTGGPMRRGHRVENKNPHNINEFIRAQEVRLVGDNVTPGVYSIAEAIKIADDEVLIW